MAKMSWYDRIVKKLDTFALDVSGTGDGLYPSIVGNPPSTLPTSPLTAPISVVSAIDFYKYGYTSRETLMSIPAFRRAATLIAGVTGNLPYHAYTDDNTRISNAFLEQPERDLGYTKSVTFTRLALDLLFEGSGLLLIRSRYSDGYPRSAEYIPFNEWQQDSETKVITYDGEKQNDVDVLKFDVPWPGLSHDALPTLNMFNKIRHITFKYFDNPQAREYFTPTEGQDPEDEEINDFLYSWEQARQAGVSAFLPVGVALNQLTQMSPEELTLSAANEFAISEVSRMTGVDPSWLAINVSTRTYSNILDERRNFIDFTAAPYVHAIEERLSLGDITPSTQYVRASMDAFLRTSTIERYQAHEIGLRNKFLTVDEVRFMERRQPMGDVT